MPPKRLRPERPRPLHIHAEGLVFCTEHETCKRGALLGLWHHWDGAATRVALITLRAKEFDTADPTVAEGWARSLSELPPEEIRAALDRFSEEEQSMALILGQAIEMVKFMRLAADDPAWFHALADAIGAEPANSELDALREVTDARRRSEFRACTEDDILSGQHLGVDNNHGD